MVVNMIIPNPDFPSNPPAFPNEVGYKHQQGGMTLRDYFAAKALPICYQYWMTDYHHPNIVDSENRNAYPKNDFDQGTKELIAEDAYEMADIMLKAREQ
jgi:hypothetical protein